MLLSSTTSLALANLERGMEVALDIDAEYPNQPPPWLDMQLYKQGQRCMEKYAVGLLVGNLRSLVIGLAITNLCDPLVVSGRSCTRASARDRYMDTALLTLRLYEEEPWSPGSLAIKIIRQMHNSAARRLRALSSDHSYEERVKKTFDDLQMEPESKLDKALLTDLRRMQSQYPSDNKLFNSYSSSSILFSQTDMALVQLAFMEQFLCHPHLYSGRWASSEDKLGLMHLWRVQGYYLGMEDIFNLGQYTLETFIEVSEHIKRCIVLPSLARINCRGLHMARSVCRGLGDIEYALVILNTLKGDGIECKAVWSQLSWLQRLKFYVRSLCMEWLLSFPLLRSLLNRRIIGFLRSFKPKKSL